MVTTVIIMQINAIANIVIIKKEGINTLLLYQILL